MSEEIWARYHELVRMRRLGDAGCLLDILERRGEDVSEQRSMLDHMRVGPDDR